MWNHISHGSTCPVPLWHTEVGGRHALQQGCHPQRPEIWWLGRTSTSFWGNPGGRLTLMWWGFAGSMNGHILWSVAHLSLKQDIWKGLFFSSSQRRNMVGWVEKGVPTVQVSQPSQNKTSGFCPGLLKAPASMSLHSAWCGAISPSNKKQEHFVFEIQLLLEVNACLP